MPACCIVMCGARKNRNQAQLTFHRFPKNERLKKKWLDAIGAENINPRHKNWFLCSLHFEETCFNRTLDVVRLRHDSVPTIFPLNPLINQVRSEFCSGLITSPIFHISTDDECETGNTAIKEELPAVSDGLDDGIEPMEEDQSDELEPENLDNSCLDIADIPPRCYESDLGDDTPLFKCKTEVEDEKVSKKKRRVTETIIIDVDPEHEFAEPGEGSDVEHDFVADTTFEPRIIIEQYPVDCDNLEDPSLAEAISSIDAEADLALRNDLSPGADEDLLSFDWRGEPENFQGIREVFTVPSGPTFESAELTPLGVFLKIWDADIIAHIAYETNRYGGEMLRRAEKPNSRLHRWKEVTDNDIRKFFAIIMLQSLAIINVEREYWYPKFDELRIGNFGAIMPYNRFLAIKRCLHFVDNASLPVHPNKLHKILPLIEHLNKKFSSLYILEQNIAIDESLLLWKGRLSFAQKITTKKARVGIKSYELCESRTGYLWRMEVYSGKGHVHVAQVGAQELAQEREEGNEPESATSQIVLNLMRPLFHRGHTLVMDNFYNAPLLSRILKVKYNTDSMGTLRLTREFVPEALKEKGKKNMRAGEVAFSSTKDLSVVVWMDKNVVSMISTFHQVEVGGIEKYGYYKYTPQVVFDYNLSMGGIDHKDQMLHAYPLERVRNIIWYKKLFRRLLNVSIHNSFVMFNHNRTQVVGNREFRLQLAKELLQMCRPVALPRQPLQPLQMHLPVKNVRAQRCKLCHQAKVRRTTIWRCSTCAVNLCIEGCYTDYHT